MERAVRTNTFSVGLLLSAASLSWFACQAPADSPSPGVDSHLAEVAARGRLTMVCFPVQTSSFVRPKLDFLRDTELTLEELRDSQAFEGIEVELLRGFAESLGVELEIQAVTTNYADVIQSVASGRGDLAASSLSITEERSKIVDFSDPTGSVWASVAVPLESTISTLADLEGKEGVGMRGSSQVEIFRRMVPEGVELTLTDFSLESYLAVTDGEADFVLLDASAEVGERVSTDYTEVKVAIRLAETLYGVAFPKDSDLRLRFNEYLAQRNEAD